MKSLGLSPTEQEVVDMQNEVEKKGRIFFPDFCKLSLRKFREFDEENFNQELFKVSIIQTFWHQVLHYSTWQGGGKVNFVVGVGYESSRVLDF